MYPTTGYPQRPGNFSSVYPLKTNFDGTCHNNMPSVHSVVTGPGYGASPPYKNAWGSTPPFENNFQLKQADSYDCYDTRNGFGKSSNGYRHHGGTFWGASPGANQSVQRVCYGECKRSGRICASCMEYVQSSYGYQKMNPRGMSQVASPPYPQRHPSWHGGNTLGAQKGTASLPAQNGFPLQRSHSTPSGYCSAGSGFGLSGSQEMESRAYWGPKSQPVDISRRSNAGNVWHQNSSPGVVDRGAYMTSTPHNGMDSCALSYQQGKILAMRSPSGAAVPQRHHNAMPRQQAQINASQWNSQLGAPPMPNSCVMGGTSPIPQQTNLDNRPGSLSGRMCTFPPTPPAEPHYAPITITSSKSMNTGSCQLSQVPQPVICSPTPSPRDSGPYWNGPSPITKQNTGALNTGSYQYCSQGKTPTSVPGTFCQQPAGGVGAATDSLSVPGAEPACASVPSSCDLENRDWQNDIADISSTESYAVGEKARVFSAELEKLARFSTTFDDEPGFPSRTTSGSTPSTEATSRPMRPTTTSCGTSVASSSVSQGNIGLDMTASNGACVASTPQSSPMSKGPSSVPNMTTCASEGSIVTVDRTGVCHGNVGVDNQSDSALISDEQGSDSDDPKAKTKHSDYLNQTSDVNPYGSQNCIAALSASCRKMIADLDKPEKEPEQPQSTRPGAIGYPQQQMCLNGFPDNTNALTSGQCYNPPSYPDGVMQHQAQSFPLDPYMQHYPQLIHPNHHHAPNNLAEKSRRGRKRKSTCGRGGGVLAGNECAADQSGLVKRPTSHSVGHLKQHHSPTVGSAAADDFGATRSSPPLITVSDSDLGNISPTFSDGPVNLDMLDSVFSPDVSLDTSSNDLSSLLDGTNSSLCDTFSEYDVTSGTNAVTGTTMTSSQGLESAKERHPLEILQDQIKIQRQQFSLDSSRLSSEKTGCVNDPERNNNKQGDSMEKRSIGSDVNDNHVIDSRS